MTAPAPRASNADDAPSAPRRPLALVGNVALALIGLFVFVHLVRASGVTLDMLTAIGWRAIAALVLASFVVIVVDTIAWRFALAHVLSPALLPLLGLRVAGDSLTNGVPGGVILGETYKAVMVRRWWRIRLSDNALALVLIKFGLGISQAVFILIGLLFCYPILRERSAALFGFEGAHYLALVLAAGMGLLLLLPLVFLRRGGALERGLDLMVKVPLPPVRRRLDARRDVVVRADQRAREVLRGHARALAITFGFLLLGWLLSVAESYILLDAMGLSPSLETAFAIEALGSLFRLIFFMVPSGIGGQDASFLALFSLYGLPSAAGGVFVLLKRFKELLWIGLGFTLIAVLNRISYRGPTPASEEPSLPELSD